MADKKNEVAEKKSAEIIAFDPTMFEADAGMGMENMGQEDLALPFLKILSGLDPLLDTHETARKGDIYNTVTGHVYTGKDGIKVIPCAYQRRFIQWAPRGVGSGAPQAIFAPGDTIPKTERSSEDNKEYVVGGEGEYIEETVRTEAVGQMASQRTSYPEVRYALLDIQRGYAKLPGLVTDGRDMGTVVFPQASFKVFLEGAAEERSKRRYKQLKSKGNNAKLSDVVDALKVRDKRDASRDIAPLKPAEDAYLIDTTHLSIDQVCQAVLDFVQR